MLLEAAVGAGLEISMKSYIMERRSEVLVGARDLLNLLEIV